ncbi:hypothetical protein OG559_19760 [Micromonospora sp. NBC_01405]|uniref:dioxygenase family protein n=1 Tax=Micromonospora sp. NBC_01405 TaxID=2903589 RepID=UPI0032543E84
MEEDLVELLASTGVTCRLLVEQTRGPYHRAVHPERREITEDRDGLPLRLGLRLLAADATTPLADVLVEVWQADHVGRYSGFQPFEARPGQVVTSESVPQDVIAPGETYLRGSQRTDERGMCAFNTIYPGWYASRTVHIHLIAHLGDCSVTTQLYFPDTVTDEVFSRPPYRGRPQRDTTNATDSIFADGGEQMILDLQGGPTTGYTGVLCLVLDRQARPASAAGPSARSDG